ASDRRIKLSIDEAWDVRAATAWGQDHESVVKAIYIPMKSEMADTINRHAWLHTVEYRLSQVRLYAVDLGKLRQELMDGVDEDWVRDETKAYVSSMSSSIRKDFLSFDEYTDDLTSIMDE
ncbi:hypothetical protein V1522DRAFT_333422, partial [Lipomyces starkeyi]